MIKVTRTGTLKDKGDHGDGSDDPHCCATYQENRPHDLRAFKDEQYDKLAKHVRQHVDIDRIYRILSGED